MDTARSWTNEEWVAALRSEEAAAITALRDYLCRSLQKALAGRSGQNDAEDFAQQALTRVLESLEKFRGDSKFTTWASAIAIRIAYSELRRKRWGDASLDALLDGGMPDSFVAVEPRGAINSARVELLNALNRGVVEVLTERQRAVVLAELEGVPSIILSEKLQMTRGAIYKMHHDARKRLRTYLEEQGFSAEDLRFVLDGASKSA